MKNQKPYRLGYPHTFDEQELLFKPKIKSIARKCRHCESNTAPTSYYLCENHLPKEMEPDDDDTYRYVTHLSKKGKLL